MSKLQLNPEFHAAEFMRRHWQQEPVFLPQLVPDFRDALSAEELAGLACEELAESRIVRNSEKRDWQLQNGPFLESDFTQLPSTNWTLLVQAVDQWVAEVADIRSLFDFIPNWRIDDVMVSFAAPGGGVGPHYDYYDVFLLQGAGQRSWSVGERCESSAELIQGTDLRLLKDFTESARYELRAGDALYIPPRYAHWGVANSDSLCYSIGFRAPSMAEMIEGFSDFIIRQQDPAERYEDGAIANDSRSGEIIPSQLSASFEKLSAAFSEKESFAAWFGCYVSQAKYPELIEPLERKVALDDLLARLDSGQTLSKNPSSRFAFIESRSSESLLFFVDGAMAVFPIALTGQIAALCDAADISRETPAGLCDSSELVELLRRLLNQGSLLLTD